MTLNENELHAYVDSALAPAERSRVEQLLTSHPDEAARARAYRQQNTQLRAQFDAVLDEPVPARLEISARTRPQRHYMLAAAGLFVGVAVGWMAHVLWRADAAPMSLAHRAAIAHVVYAPEVRHPVEVSADQRDHLVGWLSKRLGAKLKAPSLSEQGYELVGGRLLPGDSGPVAQFMYQNLAGLRLTLYVSRVEGNRSTAFRFSREDRVSVFYWVDHTLGYALSGELPHDQLLAVATAVYAQLDR